MQEDHCGSRTEEHAHTRGDYLHAQYHIGMLFTLDKFVEL